MLASLGGVGQTIGRAERFGAAVRVFGAGQALDGLAVEPDGCLGGRIP